MPILQIRNGSMAIEQYTYIHTGSLWQSGTKQRYPESHKVIPPLVTRDGKQQSWRSLETASCYSIIWRGQDIQKHNWGFFFFFFCIYTIGLLWATGENQIPSAVTWLQRACETEASERHPCSRHLAWKGTLLNACGKKHSITFPLYPHASRTHYP